MCAISNLVYDLFTDKDSSMNVLISVFPCINGIVQIDYVEKILRSISNFDIHSKNQILKKKIVVLFNFFWHFREWFLFWGIGPAELKTGYQFITLRTNTNIYGDKKDFPSYRFRISKSNSALSKLLAIKMYRYALSANRNNKYT